MSEKNEKLIMKHKEYRQINATLRRELDAIHSKLDEIIEVEDMANLNDRYADAQFLINSYNNAIITAVYIHYLRKKAALEE